MKSERPPAHEQVRLLRNMKRGVKIKCFGNHPLRIEETLYTPSRLTPDPIRLVYKQRLDLIALYPVLGRVKHWVAGDYSMEIPVALFSAYAAAPCLKDGRASTQLGIR